MARDNLKPAYSPSYDSSSCTIDCTVLLPESCDTVLIIFIRPETSKVRLSVFTARVARVLILPMLILLNALKLKIR